MVTIMTAWDQQADAACSSRGAAATPYIILKSAEQLTCEIPVYFLQTLLQDCRAFAAALSGVLLLPIHY
jgi:hypothetical protein